MQFMKMNSNNKKKGVNLTNNWRHSLNDDITKRHANEMKWNRERYTREIEINDGYECSLWDAMV